MTFQALRRFFAKHINHWSSEPILIIYFLWNTMARS